VEVATIVPCYREPLERVRRTVESALQFGRVIVVDDGCGDATLDALPCDVLHLPDNGGCSAALNAGISLLHDDDIAMRLDVGDVFYAQAKERQIQAVTSGGALCSSSPHFDPVSGTEMHPPPNWQRRIYADCVFTGCTNVYRVSVWRDVGGHDETLRYCADWDFSMKVQHHVGWHMHDEPTCEAGQHAGGLTDRGQRDPRRGSDHAVVAERGRALANPDAYAHLYNERWCRHKGIKPLKRKP
jgi:glycosyltransferase involved in cell wall biosynthesis